MPRTASLKPIIDRAVSAGVHTLVANDNTGEFYGLLPHEACALAKALRAAGVDALMVHQPPDPFVAPRGVIAYVSRIAEASEGLPLVLYLRNDAIGLDAIEALCRIPQVIGVKWASPTPMVLAEAIRRTAGLDLAWIGGLAEVWAAPFYAVGARGFTSGLINMLPQRSVAIHDALERADYPLAMKLIGEILAFERLRAQENNGANVTVVKAALRLIGEDCGATRAPSAWPLSDAAAADLHTAMRDWGMTLGKARGAEAVGGARRYGLFTQPPGDWLLNSASCVSNARRYASRASLRAT